MCGPLGCGSHGPVKRPRKAVDLDKVNPVYRPLFEDLQELGLKRGFRPWSVYEDPDAIVDVDKERIWFDVAVDNVIYKFVIRSEGRPQ